MRKIGWALIILICSACTSNYPKVRYVPKKHPTQNQPVLIAPPPAYGNKICLL